MRDAITLPPRLSLSVYASHQPDGYNLTLEMIRVADDKHATSLHRNSIKCVNTEG